MEEKVKSFIEKHNVWQEELNDLRQLLLQTQLEESVKWGMPSYGCNGQNVIGIGAFKNHIGIWFHQGALLADRHNLLINAQEGKTKAMRSIRITKEQSIDPKVLSTYIAEAIENAMAGKKVSTSINKKLKKENIEIPVELSTALTSDDTLAEMYKGLTPIQQRDYALYISEAKRASTRASRMDKIIPLIKAKKPIAALWSK